MTETLHKEILLEDVISLSSDSTVGEAFKVLRDNNLRCAPVLDGNGDFLGMFSVHEIIAHLVPLAGIYGESLSFAVGSTPDVAKKLKSFSSLPVLDFTDKGVYRLQEDVHTWEALRALTKYGSPLPVVENGGNKFQGLISEQSATQFLLDIDAQ